MSSPCQFTTIHVSPRELSLKRVVVLMERVQELNGCQQSILVFREYFQIEQGLSPIVSFPLVVDTSRVVCTRPVSWHASPPNSDPRNQFLVNLSACALLLKGFRRVGASCDLRKLAVFTGTISNSPAC
jgi:hypothetical protein